MGIYTSLDSKLTALSESLRKRPLLLVAISSVGFSAKEQVSSVGQVIVYEAFLISGLLELIGVALILVSFHEPLFSWLGTNRSEVACTILCGFFGFVGMCLTFLSIQIIPPSSCQAMAQTAPIWAALISTCATNDLWKLPEVCTSLAVAFGLFLVLGSDLKASFSSSALVSKHTIEGFIFASVGALSVALSFILGRLSGTLVEVSWPKLMLAQVELSFPQEFECDLQTDRKQ